MPLKPWNLWLLHSRSSRPQRTEISVRLTSKVLKRALIFKCGLSVGKMEIKLANLISVFLGLWCFSLFQKQNIREWMEISNFDRNIFHLRSPQREVIIFLWWILAFSVYFLKRSLITIRRMSSSNILFPSSSPCLYFRSQLQTESFSNHCNHSELPCLWMFLYFIKISVQVVLGL